MSADPASRAGRAFGSRRQPVIGGIHTHLRVTHGKNVGADLTKAEAEKYHYRMHRYENPGHTHGAG
jgi:hypothetical protein